MDVGTTPDPRNDPKLMEVVNSTAEKFLDAIAESDRDGASDAVEDAYARAGYAGVFGLCCAVAIMTMPANARVESMVVLQQHRVTGQIRAASIDDVNPVLRTVVRFIAAMTNDDIDTAWALFLTVFDVDGQPGTYDQITFITALANMLVQALAEIETDRWR